MTTKIAISAGGSGGHLFPALSLAQLLRQKQPSCEIAFIGGGLSVNRYFDSKTYPYYDIACGHFGKRTPWALASGMTRIMQGVGQSIAFLRRFQPDILVGFGSYHGFPPLAAATLLRVPTILFAADTRPGKVVRLMARWATATAVQFDAAKKALNGDVITVEPLLRPEVLQARMRTEDARLSYGLEPHVRTLLIFGGSQGARAINDLMLATLPYLMRGLAGPLQVVHLTGSEDSIAGLMSAYAQAGIQAVVKPFETDMGCAWSAADLALCRSGAGTIAEAQVFQVPLFMIPYPFAAEAHQDTNAEGVVALGAGEKHAQNTLTAAFASKRLTCLLNDEQSSLTRMRHAWANQKQRCPNRTLADVVWETLHGVGR